MTSAEIEGVRVSTEHFIGGERVGSVSTFVDLSPIDAQPIAEVARGGEREASLAVEAAQLAGRDPRSYGYEVLGPVGLRIDLVERVTVLLGQSDGTPRVQALLKDLGLEGGARAAVLRALGGQPVRTRRRRRVGHRASR